MRRAPLFALLGLALLVSAGHAQPPPSAPGSRPRMGELPLVVNVAEDEDGPVVGEEWLEGQLSNANTIFEPAGVSFRQVASHTMGPEHARLENRRDRHVLGRLLHRQRIDVFVVRSLRDVDDPSRFRQGVHWRPRGEEYPDRAHFVIVSAIAGPTVLAHELGHYFGNGHSDVPGNIMSYERGDVPPFFDAPQVGRIRFSLRRFLRREELVLASAL